MPTLALLGGRYLGGAITIRDRFETIDLAIYTVSPIRDGVVTGGPLTELAPDAADPYLEVLIPAVFHFFRVFGNVPGNREIFGDFLLTSDHNVRIFWRYEPAARRTRWPRALIRT